MSSAPVTTASSDAASSMGFNGELHERHFDWQLLGNGYRSFNPVLMRFHTPDNLSPFEEGGRNAYAYCGDDPINCHDPSGHFLQYAALGLAASALITGAGSFIARTADDPQVSETLGRLALGLGIAAAVVLGGFAMQRGLRGSSARRYSKPSPLEGVVLDDSQAVKIGNATFYPGVGKDALVTHGNRFVTSAEGPVSGTTLGRQVQQHMGSDYQYKTTLLLSCRADFGGKLASQGQAFSNTLRVKVTGMRGRVDMLGSRPVAKPGYDFEFHPQSRIRSIATRYLNEAFHRRYPLFRGH